jgi:hypothetical protein
MTKAGLARLFYERLLIARLHIAILQKQLRRSAMSFGLDSFKQSEFGRKVAAVLEDRDNVIRMLALSEHGIPAVQAIGKRIERLGRPVNDEEKKLIGRWVREVLEREGWTTETKKARVAPGNLFSTGAVYHPKGGDWSPSTTTVEAMREARAGRLTRFSTVEDLMSDLNAHD